MSCPKDSVLSVLSGRILQNLRFVDDYAPPWDSENHDDPPYSDTQLVISLLGILIFPHERAPDALGDLLEEYHGPLDEIVAVRYSAHASGLLTLPGPDGTAETIDPTSLRNLPRLLRNSIAHFNIRAIDIDGRFGGIRIWNRNRRHEIDFVADLYFDSFRPLAEHILGCLHDREGLQLADPPDPLEELAKKRRF
jgi:HEPN pEK499 p136